MSLNPRDPHLRSRRKTIAKRVEITDDEGWTHITKSNGLVSRKLKTATTISSSFPPSIKTHLNGNSKKPDNPEASSTEPHPPAPHLSPAEVPRRTTIAQLQKLYALHLQRWRSSSTWECTRNILQDHQARCVVKSLKNIVCIGLGSPSGLVRDGWVDRRTVALNQLGALHSILELLQTIGSPNIKAYAQDPVFNSFDKDLLKSVGISVVEHPAAFDLVDHQTFLYCPGAEKTHLEQLLPLNPPILFGGPLENSYDYDENKILSDFVHARQSVLLRQFEPHPETFWKVHLYWTTE